MQGLDGAYRHEQSVELLTHKTHKNTHTYAHTHTEKANTEDPFFRKIFFFIFDFLFKERSDYMTIFDILNSYINVYKSL